MIAMIARLSGTAKVSAMAVMRVVTVKPEKAEFESQRWVHLPKVWAAKRIPRETCAAMVVACMGSSTSELQHSVRALARAGPAKKWPESRKGPARQKPGELGF